MISKVRKQTTAEHTSTTEGLGAGGVVSFLQQSREAKQSQNWAAYKDLLKSLAEGESVDPVEVDLTLTMMDKSPSELESDLEEYRRRLEKYQLSSQLESRQSELRQAEADLQKAVEAISKTLAPLEAKRLAAVDKVNALRVAVDQSATTEAYLRWGCKDPVLLGREKSLREELKRIANQPDSEDRAAEIRAELDRIDTLKTQP